MILHPEYQVMARNEIDSVVGDQRLPEFEDRKRLPVVECILQETLRRVEIFHCLDFLVDGNIYCSWRSGVPLGFNFTQDYNCTVDRPFSRHTSPCHG
jgi:hypothetical protein